MGRSNRRSANYEEKRKERRPSPVEEETEDDDVIELHAEEEWLTNQIRAEAKKQKNGKKRSDKKYNSTDVCRIGLERILGITKDDSFDTLPLSVIENQIHLANMYYQRFFEVTVHEQPKTAIEIVGQQKLIEKFDDLFSNLNVLLDDRRKVLIDEQINAHHGSNVQSSTMQSTTTTPRPIFIKR